MKEKIVTVGSYGLFCLSVSVFDVFLRKNKIKTAKINKFFDKNRDLLEKAMREGAWIPIATIDSIDYLVELDDSSSAFNEEEWVKVLELAGCNLKVENDQVWVGSLGSISDWDTKIFGDNQAISYRTMDGELCYKAFPFTVPSGMYKVTLLGYKRKKEQNYPAINFGFSFQLSPVTEFIDFTNPLVNDINIADM